jgi:hypothetical protein
MSLQRTAGLFASQAATGEKPSAIYTDRRVLHTLVNSVDTAW